MDGITVVKVGGNEVEDASWVAALAAGVARMGGAPVLVHGGGKGVSELQRVLGAEPAWHEGIRITPPAALRAARMVLSGEVNKRLAAALQDAGLTAVGVSGEDGALLRASPLRGGALGRTGEVAEVNAGLLQQWLRMGIIPVLSPISRGTDGDALNVNADDVAAAVAAALGARRLLLVSNVAGVLAEGRALESVRSAEVEALVASGTATGGMTPKLRAAARAAEAGVEEVRIGGLELLEAPGAGTQILASRTAGAAA